MRIGLFIVSLWASLGFGQIDFAALEKELNTKGVVGWVHGSTQALGLYVFTYREPGDFFSHVEFPLVSRDPAISKNLSELRRHDQVRIQGQFLANSAPIRHILVEGLTMVKKADDNGEYDYEAVLPSDLEGKNVLDGKVHAVVEEGRALLIEYKDAVIPVVVTKPELAKDLFRNDKIRLKYRLRKSPKQPTHVVLDASQPEPLLVTDKMVEWHGKEGSITGELVLFPKSPQVLFNVFALNQTDELGISRQFTLLNFEDTEVFKAIRAQLQTWWDADEKNAENFRNKLINRKLRVRATGTFNVVDPGQANPQIILTGVESLTLNP